MLQKCEEAASIVSIAYESELVYKKLTSFQAMRVLFNWSSRRVRDACGRGLCSDRNRLRLDGDTSVGRIRAVIIIGAHSKLSRLMTGSCLIMSTTTPQV